MGLPHDEHLHLVQLGTLTHNIIVCADAELRIEWVNPAFIAQIGYTLKEVLGRYPWDVLGLVDADPEALGTIRPLLLAGKSYHGRLNARRKDGSPLTLFLEIHPVFEADGRLRGFVSSESDITDAEAREAKLTSSERRFRTLVEGAPVALWELRADDSTFTYVSPSTAMFGYPLDAWRTPGFIAKVLHPDDRDHVLATCRANVERRVVHDLTYRVVCADGRVVWVQDHVSAPEATAEGTLIRCVVLDITARVETEQALRASEARLRVREARLSAILEAEPECVKIVDGQGRLVQMNEAGLSMVEAVNFAEVSGLEVNQLVTPETRDVFEASLQDARKGLATRAEFEIIGLHGGRRWMEQYAVGLADDAGGPTTNVLAVTRDVTTRRRLDEEREAARMAADRANRAKSEFIANMSHEIRTPLTAILGYADVLLEALDAEHFDRQLAGKALTTIRSAGGHLHTLIGDILDLSKIEVNRMDVEKVRMSPRTVFDEVAQMARARARGPTVEVVVRCDDSVPGSIETDPTRLRQILINLVGNAMKFTEKGAVTVSASVKNQGADDASTDGSVLEVDVTDTGIGISPEQAADIFSAFGQSDSSTTRRYGGSGLGLTICRRLARLMGGDVMLLRSEPGKGSCFRLSLPVTLVDASPVQSISPCDASPGADEKTLRGHLLLAEDGEDNRELIVFHLTRAGATVDTVIDGAQALQRIEAMEASGRSYDLLVTDVQMPALDGCELTAELRRRGNAIPVIALTALATPADRIRCLEAGCDGYASKPIQRRQLIDLCHNLMASGGSPR
ncbi:MAG: PAS domain S-box protein [Myxococcales bacterium]|nr:PAS domain S-box protein [Myxococcales bacterium]